MGRFRPSYRESINRFRDEMERFRGLMRQAEQPVFDRVFEHARYHAAPAKAGDRGNFETVVLFSMMIGLQQEIRELQGEWGHLDER